MPYVVKKAKRTTQFIRSAHDILPFPLPNSDFPLYLRIILAYIPFLQTILRWIFFLRLDFDFLIFKKYFQFGITNFVSQYYSSISKSYIIKHAPAKYLGKLLPLHRFAQKRRVYDSKYLECLSKVNLSKENVVEFYENGLVLQNGEKVEANVVIYANGFKCLKYFESIELIGFSDLQKEFEMHGVQAYHGGYYPNMPNFISLLGPNTAQGHHR
jgi:hypothetical protein